MKSGEQLSGNQRVWPLREQENLTKEGPGVVLPPFTYQGNLGAVGPGKVPSATGCCLPQGPLLQYGFLPSKISITQEIRKRRGLGTLVPLTAT